MRKTIIISIILTILVSSCNLLQNGDDKGLVLPEEIRQWPDSASASSAFGGIHGQQRDDQSPYAATGSPDVKECGDSPNAWVIDTQDDGLHWLELQYYEEVHISEVKIRETYNPGSVVKIEALNNDQYVTLWEGSYTTKECPYVLEVDYTEMEGNRTVKMTSFKTDTIKITVNTDIEDWNEIDAVELIGYEERWYLYNDTVWFK